MSKFSGIAGVSKGVGKSSKVIEGVNFPVGNLRKMEGNPFKSKEDGTTLGTDGEKIGFDFKAPIHLKDGGRLRGFNDKERSVFHGVDKNGEPFSMDAKNLDLTTVETTRGGDFTLSAATEAVKRNKTTNRPVGKLTPVGNIEEASKAKEADTKVEDFMKQLQEERIADRKAMEADKAQLRKQQEELRNSLHVRRALKEVAERDEK
jgi:hypothetical protein